MHGQWLVLNYMYWSYSVELINRSRDRCTCFYVIYWALSWASSSKLIIMVSVGGLPTAIRLWNDPLVRVIPTMQRRTIRNSSKARNPTFALKVHHTLCGSVKEKNFSFLFFFLFFS